MRMMIILSLLHFLTIQLLLNYYYHCCCCYCTSPNWFCLFTFYYKAEMGVSGYWSWIRHCMEIIKVIQLARCWWVRTGRRDRKMSHVQAKGGAMGWSQLSLKGEGPPRDARWRDGNYIQHSGRCGGNQMNGPACIWNYLCHRRAAVT